MLKEWKWAIYQPHLASQLWRIKYEYFSMELENKNFLQGEGSTHLVHQAKAFWSWLCRSIQGIWNHQKIKKIRMGKRSFFIFFCPIFASDAWNMFWENWDTHARKQCELKCKALSLNCFKKRNKKFKGHFLTNRAPVYTQENFMSQIRLRNEKCFLWNQVTLDEYLEWMGSEWNMNFDASKKWSTYRWAVMLY